MNILKINISEVIGNKKDIENYLVFQEDDKEFYIEELNKNKEVKTRIQEKTYYLILNAISEHLGYDLQEVKMYMMSGCFGTHKLKLSRTEIEVPNKSKTSEFTKEEAKFFIDTLLAFCKIKNIPFTLQTRELESFYNSLN